MSVLPAGAEPPNPQELLGRPAFIELLQGLSRNFDTIILDTPASSEFADAQTVAARAGAAERGEAPSDEGLRLSVKREGAASSHLHDHVSEGDVIEGKVTKKIKGGLLVDIGVPVFLPASQVDVRRPADIGEFINRTIRASVLKIDQERRNIVISRRKLIEEEREMAKKRLLETLKEGEIVSGTVIGNIADID